MTIKTTGPPLTPSRQADTGDYPVEHLYRVGQCASGWIRFPAEGERPLRIVYRNGLGDRAVWDARDLTVPPTLGS